MDTSYTCYNSIRITSFYIHISLLIKCKHKGINKSQLYSLFQKIEHRFFINTIDKGLGSEFSFWETKLKIEFDQLGIRNILKFKTI